MFKKQTKQDIIFNIFNLVLVTIFVILVVYPLIYIVSASVSDPIAVANGEMLLLPKKVSLDGYRRIMQDSRIWLGYRNTIIYTVIGTFINVAMTILTAYPISCKDFVYKKQFTFFIIFTMYFSGGLIPTYILVSKLHMLDTIWAMILPGAVAVFNVIITKSFFEYSIPDDLKEAASLEGCTEYKYIWTILLPLSKSILAVITLFYAVGHWNEFFNALIYLSDENKFPLQLVLRSILIQNQMAASMITDLESVAEQQHYAEIIKYGVVIVSALPVLVVYPFVQKFFIKGVLIGSVKG